jgi:cellulose synthase/poly-beta-1,6-N-acetylglucosamine synthase-like glycosyltransferase
MLAVTILLFTAAVIWYITIGYPILLASYPWKKAPQVAKDLRFRAPVSVLIAVHNGEDFIKDKLESVLALDYPADLLEILVISDGSSDETDSIVEAFSDRRVRLLKIARGGKVAALNAGLSAASGEVLFFTDVRQPLDRDALSHLVANFADNTVGVVTGELRLLSPKDGQVDMDLYWRYELWARSKHSEIDSILNTTGCIYAMRKNLARPIRTDTLIDDMVLPMGAFFAGYRVIFDPAAIAFDYPVPAAAEFRRRMRTMAGAWQLPAHLPQVFKSANRMRFHFLSHKFSRLVLPWVILLTVAATIAMPSSSLRTALLAGDAALPALALLDLLAPKRFPFKRLTSAARMFLVMNAAALMSASVLFVSPRDFWRPTQAGRAREL